MSDDDDRTILVSNISPQVNAIQIRELFTIVGKIVELNFVPASSSTTAGTTAQCWIEYAKNETAKASLYLDNTQLGDRALKVVLKSEMPPPPTEEERLKLQAEAELAALKAPPPVVAAPISSAPVPTSSAPTSSTPLTPFESLMLQNPALQALQQQQLSSTAPLDTSGFASSTPASVPSADPSFTSRTVYVGNLGPDASDALLRLYFGALGEVVATRFSGDAGAPTRYAFVEFATQDAANAALAWDQRVMIDRTIKVGKASSSITRFGAANQALPPALTTTTTSSAAPLVNKPTISSVDPNKLSAAMEKVRAAQAAIAQKLADPLGSVPAPVYPSVPLNPATLMNLTAATGLPSSATALPSASSTSSTAREERKSRSRSRSPPPRPDYAERMRLKKEREAMLDAQRYAAAAMYPPPGAFYPPPMVGVPGFDRWNSGSDRDRERHSSHSRSRDRSYDRRDSRDSHRDRDRSHHRSRSRSNERHRSSRDRSQERKYRNRRPTPGKVDAPPNSTWDGYQWIPTVVPSAPQ